MNVFSPVSLDLREVDISAKSGAYPVVTVVTPTMWRQSLVTTVLGLKRSTFRSFEQIVVSDGPIPDERYRLGFASQAHAANYRIRLFQSSERLGNWGNALRDYAIEQAAGEFVCFLDDDDVALDWWLESFGIVDGVDPDWDLSTALFMRNPGDLFGVVIAPGMIGTSNVMVRTKIAREHKWADGNDKGHRSDFDWISRVVAATPEERIHRSNRCGLIVNPSNER